MTPSRAGLRAGASTVGALPRRYRHAAGLTQEALAAWAGQSRRGLQHLEASEALPERALHLPGAAAAMRDAIGSPRKPAEGARLDRGLAAARVAL